MKKSNAPDYSVDWLDVTLAVVTALAYVALGSLIAMGVFAGCILIWSNAPLVLIPLAIVIIAPLLLRYTRIGRTIVHKLI